MVININDIYNSLKKIRNKSIYETQKYIDKE